jgi:hypothetical protein
MLNIFENRKIKILNYITGNFSKKFVKNKNFIFVNRLKYNKKDILAKKIQNLDLVLIKIKKNKFFQILRNFIAINNYGRFKKNFILVYNFKNYITAYNLIPDWPGKYQKLNILKCLCLWIKNILKMVIYFNKIELIILERR